MCISCGMSGEKLLTIKNGYTIVKCPSCDLIYVKHLSRIEDLKSFYSSDYFFRQAKDNIGYKNYLQDEAAHRLNADFLLNDIQKVKKAGNLLDLGCGYGFFLDEARKKRWNAYGVDISEVACKYAKEKLGLNIFNCDLSTSKFGNEFFDVICLLGSMEHMLDPFSELKEINRVAKKDALLVISTLDIDGIIKYLRLYQYKPPEHLYYFSKKAINALLNKADFYIEKVNCCWKYYSLGDLVKRLEEFFFGGRIALSSLLNKAKLKNSIVKIPTNEMLVFARKKVANYR